MSQAWGDRDPDVLSVNEAAAILRRGPGFVRGLIESGAFPTSPTSQRRTTGAFLATPFNDSLRGSCDRS